MSTLKADTIQSTGGGAATLTKQVAAKMQYGINGSDAAIRQSLNVASTTDSGTGQYLVNVSSAFANQMDDSGLAIMTGGGESYGRYAGGVTSTTVLSIRAHDNGGNAVDRECNGAAFGDLA
jgi:hypothetical protein